MTGTSSSEYVSMAISAARAATGKLEQSEGDLDEAAKELAAALFDVQMAQAALKVEAAG